MVNPVTQVEPIVPLPVKEGVLAPPELEEVVVEPVLTPVEVGQNLT